jgi:hypothetical protein
MNLRTALANIHRDSQWWRKIMIGGGLMMTIIGYPFAAGLVVENMDNTRKGYPTPLPPWGDWSSRYLIGVFAWLIDFLFFVLPLLAAGLIFFCVGIGSVIGRAEGATAFVTPIIIGGLVLFLGLMFLSGVSAVGRLIFVEEGGPEHAMSAVSLRETLRPGARSLYARARFASLPAYLPFLLVAATIVFVARQALDAGLLLVIPLVWLLLCTLLYAHLVVGQLYAAADKELEARGLGRLENQAER